MYIIYKMAFFCESEKGVELTLPTAFHIKIGEKGSQFYSGAQERKNVYYDWFF